VGGDVNYKDIADDPEDDRITKIGEKVMKERLTVGFITDAEEGKADRYIRKLSERFPGIRVIWRGNGPVAETVLVKVGPPTQ
jgi:hypothetical protein